MPFILQDGQLVEVTDAQFAAFGGGEAQLRTTTAAERRAKAAAEAAAAGGQNVQTTSTETPAANAEIINPNTTNNSPGQMLTPVPAPMQSTGSTITYAPPIPGVEPAPSGWKKSAQDVKFTEAELNAAGITYRSPDIPMAGSENTAAQSVNTSFQVVTPQGTLIFPNEQTYQDWQNNPQSVAFSTGPEGQYVSTVEPVPTASPTEVDPFSGYPTGEVDPFGGFPTEEPQTVNALDDPYIDEGARLTEFTADDEVRWSEEDALGLDSPYQDTEGATDLNPDAFEAASVDPEEDPYAKLVADTEAEGGLVEFGADGAVGRSAAEIQASADQQQAILAQARAQAALREQRRQANDGDWRVKLRLAPGANYLYRADDGSGRNAGILQPLANTDGVVFPYTPQIQTTYKASYSSYDLTHSNYRGYFYQNSAVEEINITATFTAQDTAEANYLLAVIHFFRSITKMFYGQDQDHIGSPPPLVFLQGLGQYQFNLHPCLVSQFNYNLPNDVDYIRAGSPNQLNTNLLQKRQRQTTTTSTNAFESAWQRLKNAGGSKGGIPARPAPSALGTDRPTYVPTKIDISLILLPIQTRSQVSKQFSLKQYANGDLLKGGFW